MNRVDSLALFCFIIAMLSVATLSFSADKPKITEITLERTSCKGPCPVYRVVLLRDGTAIYTGKAHIERIGAYQGKIHLSRFLQLARLLQSEGFFDLMERFSKDVVDSPSAITSAVRGEQRKTIHNHADAGPAKLWGIEMAIDAVVAEIKWEKRSS